MNICIVNQDTRKTSGVYYHRLLTPNEYVSKITGGDVFITTHFSSLPIDVKEKIDLVVFSKVIPFYTTPLLEIEEASRYAKVIMDIDDVWYDHEGHIMDGMFNTILKYSFPYDRKTAIEILFNKVDAITTPSKFLKDKIVEISDTPVYILPNLIDTNREQYKVDKTPSDKFRVGYMGNAMHLHDFKVCAPSLREFINKVGCDNVEFYYAGYSKEKEDKQLQIVIGHLPKGFKNIVAVPYTDYHNYARFYNHIDVALAPIRDIEFNWGKSILKISEASVMNTCIIPSDVEPYTSEAPSHIPLAKTKKDWVNLLSLSYVCGGYHYEPTPINVMDNASIQPRLELYKKLTNS